MQPLRLTTVQTHLAWEDPLQNRHHLTQLLAPLSGSTDVVVLPEMFTTGFSMRPAPLAESMDGPTLTWMREQASELQSALVGSLIIEEGGHYYNRLCWVDPDGPLATYDKRHRFTLAGEHEHYRAGQSRTIIPYRGWRILPLICYDLRFPVWSRNAGDYDLLLYVAN